MNTSGRQAHWQNIYTTKADTDVSWFEGSPAISLALIHAAGTPPDAAVIDIGGGAARLVDALLAQSFADVTVLDLSAGALAVAQARLGMQAERVDWVVADVTRWEPARQYDLWHDRAACHFMVEPDDQRAYVRTLSRALRRGGVAIIGTFAPDGPERCSGLPVHRHDAASLARMLGGDFTLLESRPHDHLTPWGAVQHFQFSMFRHAVV